jgi:hypothetical protein
MSEPNGEVCLWCGKGFASRRDGGKRQVFCRPACRRGIDAAGRRWVSEAIATGTLTVEALRNGAATTRALPPGAIAPAAISEHEKPALVASGESPDEGAELLDELLDRVDRYLEARSS